MSIFNCKWCNSSTIKSIPFSRFNKRSRWLCKDCGAIGYIQDPSANELTDIYKAAWNNNISNRFASGSTDGRIATSLIKALCGSKVRGSCLEFGGGHGKFANALLQYNPTEIFVYEPFGFRRRIPGVTWFSEWEDLPIGKKFDWIFMVEVIEHLLNPVVELARIRSILNPGGKLAITTPNTRGWRSIKEGIRWQEAQNPTHINLFSTSALKLCLKQSGFKKIKRIYQPVQYKSKKLFNIILGVTQVIGIDGGIRIVAQIA